MELLAPVGNLENFAAAVESGADAVYVGAPGFNARNISRELTLAEISGMLEYCRRNGLRFYLAANSLLLENELPFVVKSLAQLEVLEPDGLIVQDLGLLRIIREYFPSLPLHASTLMAAHNLDGVKTMQSMGCERVVLAREMTLQEIQEISARSEVELEVFVHGAMCYSYSGLCLFSSYFGGKSGLRGNCVQPCRRAYSYQQPSRKPVRGSRKNKPQGKKEYLFSMNDLNGLEVVPHLQKAGIASLKIEGRLRSAHYVSKVVRAYRMVMDADPDQFERILPEAQELIEGSMSRKVTPGYFHTQRPEEIITPHHSGNIGLYLGKIEKQNKSGADTLFSLKLAESLSVGDRVRIHESKSGERHSVTVGELQVDNKSVQRAQAGQRVFLVLPQAKIPGALKFADIYKVDVKSDGGAGGRISRELNVGKENKKLVSVEKKRHRYINKVTEEVWLERKQEKNVADKKEKPIWKKGRGGFRKKQTIKKSPLEIWMRTDSLKTVLSRLPFHPDRIVLNITDQLVSQAGLVKRALGARSKKAIWALPPIINGKDIHKIRKHIKTLMRNGYRSFQLGHIGQGVMFENEKVHLFGDYTLNFLNNQAIRMGAELGLEAAQVSVESDKDSIADMLFGYKKFGIPTPKGGNPTVTMKVGMTVYGRPALYTSRLHASHFQLGKPLVSPKNEKFVIQKKDNLVQTYPDRPFSLLPYQRELKNNGVDYGVIDIVGINAGKKELLEINERLTDSGKYSKLPTFNYLGVLE